MPPDSPQIDPRTDDELVAAANQGDAAAFGALYSRYRDWAINLAFRFTRDRHIAMDITQECFIYLLRKFPGFVLTANIKTLLYTAIKHRAIDRARQRQRQGPGDDALAAMPAPTPPKGGDQEILAAVLSRVPGHQREVLVLRFVEGFRLEEIAVALEIPVGTVKSRLHLAIKVLREDPDTRKLLEP